MYTLSMGAGKSVSISWRGMAVRPEEILFIVSQNVDLFDFLHW